MHKNYLKRYYCPDCSNGTVSSSTPRVHITKTLVKLQTQTLLEGHFSLRTTLGIGVRTMQRIVKRVANRAHISRDVTPHVLRHTFSVTAVQKGLSLPPLQQILGHDYLTTTEIYLNLSPEDVVREFNDKW
jgi:integrase/recombinase XerD